MAEVPASPQRHQRWTIEVTGTRRLPADKGGHVQYLLRVADHGVTAGRGVVRYLRLARRYSDIYDQVYNSLSYATRMKVGADFPRRSLLSLSDAEVEARGQALEAYLGELCARAASLDASAVPSGADSPPGGSGAAKGGGGAGAPDGPVAKVLETFFTTAPFEVEQGAGAGGLTLDAALLDAAHEADARAGREDRNAGEGNGGAGAGGAAEGDRAAALVARDQSAAEPSPAMSSPVMVEQADGRPSPQPDDEEIEEVVTAGAAASEAEAAAEIFEAAGNDDEHALRSLLSGSARAAHSSYLDVARGWRAIHAAAASGSVECVQLLLEHGADACLRTELYSSTPLHWAANYGHASCVRLLLQHGADPDAQNREGRTPAYMAAINSHADVLRLLGEAGGDLGLKDHLGESPATAASTWGKRASVAFLKSWIGSDGEKRARADRTSRVAAEATGADAAGARRSPPELSPVARSSTATRAAARGSEKGGPSAARVVAPSATRPSVAAAAGTGSARRESAVDAAEHGGGRDVDSAVDDSSGASSLLVVAGLLLGCAAVVAGVWFARRRR